RGCSTADPPRRARAGRWQPKIPAWHSRRRRPFAVLKHVSAAYSGCSPPPCGEGLGVGVHRRITAGPPPRRFAPTLPTRGRVRPSSSLALIPVHVNALTPRL